MLQILIFFLNKTQQYFAKRLSYQKSLKFKNQCFGNFKNLPSLKNFMQEYNKKIMQINMFY